MNKSKLIAFCLSVLLCVSLSSCQGRMLPKSSKNFDESFTDSFFENYHVIDPQLSYFSASPWEVQLMCENNEMDSIFLAKIDDIDQNQFVSGTEHSFLFAPGGGPQYYTHVYQHMNAPTPMEDWTIKSVSVIASTIYNMDEGNVDEAAARSENLMQLHLSSSENLATYDKTTAPELLNVLKEAYMNRALLTGGTRSHYIGKDAGKSTAKWYSLLIQFEESSNMVWYSSLYEHDDGMYFECYSYEMGERNNINREFALIDSEYAMIIKELLIADGWVEEVVEEEGETSASSETTDPSGTTADPEITRDEPFYEGTAA